MQYFFAKKMDVLFFTAIFFSKNPLGLDIVSAFFLTTELYFLFFYFFLVPNLRLRDNQSGGKKRQRQLYGGASARSNGILLCAVTEVYRRLE